MLVANVSPGPVNESAQHVAFDVSDDNPALFTPSGRPALAANGAISFTTAPRATGTASVTVRARDDGGTANGGADTTEQTFAITVLPVNDAPTVTGGGDQAVLEDGGPQALAWATFARAARPTRQSRH